MNKKALFGILIALIIPILGYFYIKSLPPAAMPHRIFFNDVSTTIKDGKQVTDTQWHKVPNFTMTNQLGQKVSMTDLTGKIVVVNFFFTHCPTICPQMTVNMKLLQDKIRKRDRAGNLEVDFIHFLSFSIDPDRDSVAALKRWADRFQINSQNWWLLTGNKKEIYDLSINEMKLMAVDGQNVDTSFIHTDFFMLLDKEKVIRARKDKDGNPKFYHGLDSNDIKALAEDIVLLGLEKDRKRKSIFAGKLELLAIVFLIAFLGIGLLIMFFKKDKKRNELNIKKE